MPSDIVADETAEGGGGGSGARLRGKAADCFASVDVPARTACGMSLRAQPRGARESEA